MCFKEAITPHPTIHFLSKEKFGGIYGIDTFWLWNDVYIELLSLSQKVRILYSSNRDRFNQKFNVPRTYSLGRLQCGLLKQRNSEHSLNANKQHFQSKGSQFCANGKMQWEREPLLAYMSIGHKKALFRERCNSEILRKANQKEIFFESLSIRLLQNLFVMLKRSFRLLNYLGWSGITRSEHVGLLLKPFY